MPSPCPTSSALCSLPRHPSNIDQEHILRGAVQRAASEMLLRLAAGRLVESQTLSRMAAISFGKQRLQETCSVECRGYSQQITSYSVW